MDRFASHFDALGLSANTKPNAPDAVSASIRRAHLATWLELLTQWNARIDLTAARSDEELLDLMLADAIVLARDGVIPQGARVLDVGSGAGAPGLALAILRPDLKVTLVEPLTKRVSFLRTVLGTIGRTDIELVRERVEDVANKEENLNAWDVAISRATLAPSTWILIGLTLAESTWALLAKEEPPAIANTKIGTSLRYEWPLTKASRTAVRYTNDR